MAELAGFHVLASPHLQSWMSKTFHSYGKKSKNVNDEITETPSSTHNSSHSEQLYNDCHQYSSKHDVLDSCNILLRKHQPVTLCWKNIKFSTKKGKTVLQDLKGVIQPGELMAIMGPRGAGKTTLLSILSGFQNQKYSGKILVNNSEREISSFRNLSCYVPQENLLHEYLTVAESVNFAASFKLPNSITKMEKQALVQSVVTYLGLHEIQDVRAGKLTNIEKKKLSIAQEIITNPSLIFLDEPTSGLDSSSDFQCMQLLKKFTQEGRSVVCTISEPSSRVFSQFDKLYLIASTQCVYQGPTEELIPFLNNQGFRCPQYYNPADFAMEVLMGEHGKFKLNQIFAEEMMKAPLNPNSAQMANTDRFSTKTANSLERNSRQDNRFVAVIKELIKSNNENYSTSFCHQFRVLAHRNLLNSFRNPIITHFQIVASIIGGLFAGVLFYDVGSDPDKNENIDFLYFCTFFAMFGSMFASVLTFPRERTVVCRERMNNWYSTTAYFLSKWLTDIPHQIVLPLVFSSLVYWMTSQPPEANRFYLFLLTTILMWIGSQALSSLIGTIFNTKNAILVMCSVAVLMSIFSGFLIKLKAIPGYLWFLTYFSYPRYIAQSLVFSVYGMNRTETECITATCVSTKELIDNMDVKEMQFLTYFGVPVIFIIVYRFLSFIIFHFKAKYIK